MIFTTCQQSVFTLPKSKSGDFIVTCVQLNFASWLENQLSERNWKAADLAREMGDEKKYSGTISRLLNEQRGPGDEVCRLIARAFHLPQAVVFYYAGLLTEEPDGSDDDLEVEQLLRKLQVLPEEVRREAERYIDFLLQRAREKENAEVGAGTAKK